FNPSAAAGSHAAAFRCCNPAAAGVKWGRGFEPFYQRGAGAPQEFPMQRVAWGLLGGLLVLGVPARAGDKKGVPEGNEVTLDGVKATARAEGKRERPANRLRSSQCRLPRAKDDPADAELAILPNVSGPIEKNIARWKDMFEPPADKKIDDVSRVE